MKHCKSLEKALKAILDKILSKYERAAALKEICGLLRLMYEENSNYAWIVRVLTSCILLSWKPKPIKISNSMGLYEVEKTFKH